VQEASLEFAIKVDFPIKGVPIMPPPRPSNSEYPLPLRETGQIKHRQRRIINFVGIDVHKSSFPLWRDWHEKAETKVGRMAESDGAAERLFGLEFSGESQSPGPRKPVVRDPFSDPHSNITPSSDTHFPGLAI